MPVVLPTAYFGNISYFRALCAQSSVLIESKEHFIKQTFRSRCEILSANGIQRLSVPVKRIKGSKTPIDEVEITYETNWRKDHWKAIESAYASAPYFEHYAEEVKALIYDAETNLIRFNTLITKKIVNWLSIEIEFALTNEYQSSDTSIDFSSLAGNVIKPYLQVYFNQTAFVPDVSILDLLFCEGPLARKWLID